MKKIVALSIVLCFVLTACNCKKKATAADKPVSSTTEREANTNAPSSMMKTPGVVITNKYWKAVELMGEKVTVGENMSKEPYIQLKVDGTFKGHGGCNSMFGSYNNALKNFLTFKDIAMTEMDCGEGHYDQKLIQALELTQQFILIGEDKLQLIVGKRAPLAVFEAVYFE